MKKRPGKAISVLPYHSNQKMGKRVFEREFHLWATSNLKQTSWPVLLWICIMDVRVCICTWQFSHDLQLRGRGSRLKTQWNGMKVELVWRFKWPQEEWTKGQDILVVKYWLSSIFPGYVLLLFLHPQSHLRGWGGGGVIGDTSARR